MNNVDVMDAVQQGVEIILYKNWRHEGHIDGFGSDQIAFVVDGKRYILKLEDVEDLKK
jgi:hypothetical protein